MADDTVPQDDPRTLTTAEKYGCAADWSDYRKDFGVSPDGRERMHEFRAFQRAWQVEHVRHVDAASEDLTGWADWFESVASHVGGQQSFTAEEVAALLRGPNPFGVAAAQ